MKKLLVILSVLTLVLSCAAFSAAAEDWVDFTADVDAGATGTGGYFAKSSEIEIEDTDNGVKLTQVAEGENARVVWAYPDAVANTYRYIVYTIEAETAPVKLGLSRNLSVAECVEMELDASYCTPGTHVIDTVELGADLPSIGYYYFNVYGVSDRSVIMSDFYMTDTEPVLDDDTGDDTGAETGAESAVAVAVAAVVGAGALLMISRKK